MENNQRRNFLKAASLAGIVAIGSPGDLFATSKSKAKKISLSNEDVILFQGDSITDAGRNRNAEGNNSLGTGYAFLATAGLMCESAKNVRVYNRGISGNKVYQLAERWDTDALALKPTILSIMIGVNDYWHMHNKQYDGTLEVYRNDYRALLTRTKKELPNVKLIIGEPFAIKGVKAVDDSWYPEFDKYREVARAVANEFNAVFIPYQSVFDAAIKKAPANFWTGDGVHTTLAGSQLMANAWLGAFDL